MTATGICENFTVSHPAISQHLKVLREANLLHVEKHAQQRLYKINTGAVQELEEWARQIADLWNQRFEALDKVLAEEQLKEHTKKVRKNV